jgi:hypothetical protein
MIRRGDVAMSLFILIALAGFRPAVAQGGRFDSEAVVTFGQQVVFTLTAVTDEPLTAVTLNIDPTYGTAQVEALQPTQIADGSWQAQYELLPQTAGLSPFSTITYEWQVTTEKGDIISIPAQQVTYQDDRFAWKKIEQPVAGTAVTIFWPGDSDKPGRVSYEMVQQTAARLQVVLPLAPDTALPVFLYPSSADLRAALRLNGHDWVKGHTDPALGAVLVTAVNDKTAAADLQLSLPHELAHFWLYQAVGSGYADIPYWFKEGWAVWVAGNGGSQRITGPLPLADLCGTDTSADEELAARQGGAVVQFVAEQYGRDALAGLALAFASGEGCDTAVPTVLGQTMPELEAAWLAAQQPQPAAIRFLQQNGIWLLLLLAGFGLMGLLLIRPLPR